jgi:hypothetical protein
MIKSATVELIAFVHVTNHIKPAVEEDGVSVESATASRSFKMSVEVRPTAFNHDDEEIMDLEVIYLAQAAALRLLRKEMHAIQATQEEVLFWEHEFHISNTTYNLSEE